MSGGSQLQLSPLQPFHQGRYTCLVQGTGSETRKDFLVLVRGRASCSGSSIRGEPSFPSSASPSLSSLSPRCSGTPDHQRRGP